MGHFNATLYILYTIYYILYTIYYILYTIYYILYTVYCILYTIYYILYTILFYIYIYKTIYIYTYVYIYILYHMLHINMFSCHWATGTGTGPTPRLWVFWWRATQNGCSLASDGIVLPSRSLRVPPFFNPEKYYINCRWVIRRVLPEILEVSPLVSSSFDRLPNMTPKKNASIPPKSGGFSLPKNKAFCKFAPFLPYPLVNIQKAVEHDHRHSGFSH